jgi:hypothetical protein
METRPESLSPNKNEKLRMDIKINYLNQLSDRVLYDLDPKNSIKLDRNGLIRHLAETRDLDDIHLDIVTNPDIYDTSYVDQLYTEQTT